MDILQKYLSELKIYPKNVERIKDSSGFKIYTSNELKEKFIESIHNSDMANELKDIDLLVSKGIVVPVFTTKGFIRFIMNKRPRFSYDLSIHVLGSHNKITKKIYIYIDNNSDISGKSDDNKLARIVVHELMHFYANIYQQNYLKLFMDDLVKYYKYVFDILMNENYSKNLFKKFIIGLFSNFERKNEISLKEFKKYLIDMLDAETSDKKLLKKTADYIIRSFSLRNTAPYYVYRHRDLRKIPLTFQDAYHNVFGLNIKEGGFLQEIIITSEVIAKLAGNLLLQDKVKKITSEIIQKNKK